MLSILMPVYNERERVERAISEVLDTPLPTEFELIVVDDGSTDGTREILRNLIPDTHPPSRVRLFEHPENRGKGAAVQTALSHAQGEYSAIFDADLEYDPTDLGLLMPPLLDGRTNASFGVRAFDGYTSHSFLFVARQQGRHARVQPALQRVPARHHDLSQDDPDRHLPKPAAALARLRDRARDHREAGAARRADLRGPGPLPGPRHRARARS